MAEDAVVERLDRLTAILQLAHKDALDRARASIRADKVNAAILDGAKKWTAAGKLKAAVMKKTDTGATTLR
jgi:hypothetical protein